MRGFPRAAGGVAALLAIASAVAVGEAIVALAARPAYAAGDEAASSHANVEIDRVEIVGVTLLPQPDLEAALEIGPGDPVDRARVVRSAENIQALYRIKGYEQVSIQSRLMRKRAGGEVEEVLEFNVVEGKPTRIAAITFASELPAAHRPGMEDLQRYWRELKPALAARLGLGPDDLLDQEKLALARRNVQEYLAGQEFVGAKVEDVRVVTLQAPPGKDKDPVTSGTGRWVSLEFQVRLGDRVSFGFRGNKVFGQSRLSALVEEQRVLGLGRDYVAAIRGRIEAEYHGVGYAQVRVEALTFEGIDERHVTYVIHEGPRVRIASVEFDGNLVFPSDELKKEFYDQASAAVQSGWYVEKDVQKAAEAVVEWIKSKGYLTSRLITVNTVPVPPRQPTDPERSVRLVVYIYESDQTVVQSVSLKGLRALSLYEAKSILQVREGAPLNLSAFGKGVDKLREAYRARGYLGMRIASEDPDKVVLYSQEGRFADIILDLEEGPMYRVSRVLVEGRSFTDESVIRRELVFHDNEVLKEPDMAESEARLRRLGIFSAVSLRTSDDPDRPGFKIVRVAVQEGTPGVIGGGAGFRNDLGVRGFGEFGYTNLWGKNHTISLNLNANRRLESFRPAGDQILVVPGQAPVNLASFQRENYIEYQAQVAYQWPWFMGNELNFRPSFTVGHTEYILFDAFTMSAALTWEKRLLRDPKLTGSFTYSLERVNQTNAIFAQDLQDQTIGSVTPALRLDTRDNPLAPTSGLFALTSLEYASPGLGSHTKDFTIGYTRWLLRGDYSVPLPLGIVGFVSFRTGLLRNTEPQLTDGDPTLINQSGSVPLIKQFTLGGAGSLRGFAEQELNSQALQIHGTQSYVNYRAQLDFPFSGGLRLAAFIDAGNLQVDTYSFGNLHYGTGFGLHYVTPVGPVNFDLGFKPAPRANEEVGPYFYFSIGVI